MKWFAFPARVSPDTWIRLGQIIPAPRQPTERYAPPLPHGPEDKTYHEPLIKSAKVTMSSGGTTNVGFAATVFSILQCGSSGEGSSDVQNEFDVGNIESQTFDPSEDYIRESIRQPAVISHLAEQKYRKSVYMIVGIQVAQGG